MTKHLTKRGFTLLETMIYIALFSILMSGLLLSAYSLIESGERNRESLLITEEGMFVERKFAWALTNATDVMLVNQKTLRIERPDLGFENPLVFSEESGMLYLSRGDGPKTPLVSKEFVVNNTEFAVESGNIVTARFDINDRTFMHSTTLMNTI